jgi:hypothetical protein
VKKILVVAAVLMLAPAAFAKKGASNKKNHHCEVDGKEVTATHKACTKQKGKWVKDAAAPAAAPAK